MKKHPFYIIAICLMLMAACDLPKVDDFIPIAADFSVSNDGCIAPCTVSFTNNSQGDGLSYQWSFGDPNSGGNNTSTQENPTHEYVNPGIYTVQLTVTDASNQQDTATQSVTIQVPPGMVMADFTIANDSCVAPCTVAFTNNSLGENLTYLWDFGDPASGNQNISSLENPTHAYAQAGTYQVQLIVSNPDSQSDTLTSSVTIRAQEVEIVASFTVENDSCIAACTVTFTNTSQGNALTYLWDFGDPDAGPDNSSAQENPTHLYNSGGSYQVILQVTDSAGITLADTQTVFIQESQLPIASFRIELDGDCPTLPCQARFINESENATSFQWDFDGDGTVEETVSGLEDRFFTYQNHGRYSAVLTASNGVEFNSDTLQIDVLPATFYSFYDQSGDDAGQSAALSTDRMAYAITGTTEDEDVLFLTLDLDGNILAGSGSLGSAGFDGADLTPTSSGGFVVLANSNNKLKLINTTTGTENEFFDSNTRGNAIAATASGEFIVAARNRRLVGSPTNTNNWGYFLFRFNNSLQRLSDEFAIWTSIGEGPSVSGATVMTLTQAGQIVAAGDTYLDCTSDFGENPILTVTQSTPSNLNSGTLCTQLDLNYGGVGSYIPSGIQELPNGAGYIFSGRSTRVEAGGAVVRLDGSFTFKWEAPFGSGVESSYSSTATSVALAHDGGVVVAGYDRETFSDPFELLLIKYDIDGNEVWQKRHPVPEALGSSSRAYDIIATDDSGFLITGEIFGGIDTKVLLLKTDSQGEIWE